MVPTRHVVAITAAVGFAAVVVRVGGAPTEAALLATVVAPATEVCLRPSVRTRLYGDEITLSGRSTVVACFTLGTVSYLGGSWYVLMVTALAMLAMVGVGFENGLDAAGADDD